MKRITIDTLLELGFVKDPERRTKWDYNGIKGSFGTDLRGNGVFYFFDCSLCIEYIDDLYFMVRLIEHDNKDKKYVYPTTKNKLLNERVKTDKERDCEI